MIDPDYLADPSDRHEDAAPFMFDGDRPVEPPDIEDEFGWDPTDPHLSEQGRYF